MLQHGEMGLKDSKEPTRTHHGHQLLNNSRAILSYVLLALQWETTVQSLISGHLDSYELDAF